MSERRVTAFAAPSKVRLVFSAVAFPLCFVPLAATVFAMNVSVDGVASFSPRQVIEYWVVTAVFMAPAFGLMRATAQQLRRLPVVTFVEHSEGVWIATVFGVRRRAWVVEGEPETSVSLRPVWWMTNPWGYSWVHLATVATVDGPHSVYVMAGELSWRETRAPLKV